MNCKPCSYVLNHGRKKVLNSLIAAFLLLIVPSVRAEIKPPSVTRFKVGGYSAFVMEAKNPGRGKPWVWYAPTLKKYPHSRQAWYFSKLVEEGISIAGIDQGEVRGSPASNLRFTAFYDEMVRLGFSKRPIQLGQSRGGLMMLSWATENPDKLSAFVGIYPVCNLASWPLKNSKAAVIEDYAIPEAELLANLKRYNPIDNLQGLLQNKIPIFIIHGNADEVVPYEENSKLVRNSYEAAGGNITVKIVDGGKHEESNAFFECQELLDFIVRKCTAAQSPPTSSNKPASAAGRPKETALKLLGNRFFTFATIIRVNQIEVSRDRNEGVDESGIHTPEGARIFRETIDKCWPGARISWAFSWLALNDQRQNYKGLRELVVSYHKKYGDEITFIPGAYFSPMYNTREQTNRDLHDGLQLVSEMVGGGYRPLAIIGGFMAAENLSYLAEKEGIHVCQGNIWSQYAVDNGDGEGSVSYPYYPSREHFCKPAQNKRDMIDCVNLDGWTVDFLMARYSAPRFINGIRCGSRQGVGPIETILRQGIEPGTKEVLATTAAHFDTGFTLNKFAWVTCIWELSLVSGRNGQKGIDGLEIWLNEMRRRWPESKCITHGEFGMIWRKEFKNNDSFNYQFIQRGSGICGSEPEIEIRWFMNKDFRLALLRNWQANTPEKLIDFTRYDLKAQEPEDPKPGQNTRNWSLMNRLNQKGIRPQDKPLDIGQLDKEEKQIIKRWYPELISGKTR